MLDVRNILNAILSLFYLVDENGMME